MNNQTLLLGILAIVVIWTIFFIISFLIEKRQLRTLDKQKVLELRGAFITYVEQTLHPAFDKAESRFEQLKGLVRQEEARVFQVRFDEIKNHVVDIEGKRESWESFDFDSKEIKGFKELGNRMRGDFEYVLVTLSSLLGFTALIDERIGAIEEIRRSSESAAVLLSTARKRLELLKTSGFEVAALEREWERASGLVDQLQASIALYEYSQGKSLSNELGAGELLKRLIISANKLPEQRNTAEELLKNFVGRIDQLRELTKQKDVLFSQIQTTFDRAFWKDFVITTQEVLLMIESCSLRFDGYKQMISMQEQKWAEAIEAINSSFEELAQAEKKLSSIDALRDKLANLLAEAQKRFAETQTYLDTTWDTVLSNIHLMEHGEIEELKEAEESLVLVEQLFRAPKIDLQEIFDVINEVVIQINDVSGQVEPVINPVSRPKPKIKKGSRKTAGVR